MSETVTSGFRVKDVLRNEFILKDVEKGLTVFVQRERHRYSSEMWNELKDLSETDLATITLESQNDMHTVWEITEIEDKVSR